MQKLKTPHSQALVTIGSVLLSALLQTYVIQTMMQPTGLLSGGFTGLAILLDRIAGVIGFPFSVSAGILMLNIPLALICYRRLSKRFTLYSSIQFLSSSIFLQLFHFQPLVHDLLHYVAMRPPGALISLRYMYPTAWENLSGAMCSLETHCFFVYPACCLAGCMQAIPFCFSILQQGRLKCFITAMNV